MADTKVSDLTALTGAGAATGDLFLVIDVSAATGKKITLAELAIALKALGIAPGSDTQIAYNSGGALSSEAAFTYDPATNTLTAVTIRGETVSGSDGVTRYGQMSALGMQLADRPLSAATAIGTAPDIGLVRGAAGEWWINSGDWSDPTPIRNLRLAGLRTAVVTKSANYTATANDQVILVDCTGGAVTITLPAIATANRGKEYRIKKIDASGNAVTVARSGSDTIDGATSSSLTAQYQSKDYVAPDAGADWGVF